MLLLDMHLSFFNDHRKEVIVTLPVQRLGLLLQTAEELSWCLPSWVIPHMDNFPPQCKTLPMANPKSICFQMSLPAMKAVI